MSSTIIQLIEKARLAQQTYEQKHDVQLEIEGVVVSRNDLEVVRLRVLVELNWKDRYDPKIRPALRGVIYELRLRRGL